MIAFPGRLTVGCTAQLEGTPLPPGVQPSGSGPEPPPPPPPPGIPAAPSSFNGGGADGPSVAVASYDPRTGRYVGPDGMAHTQSDLVADSTARDWKELILKPDA